MSKIIKIGLIYGGQSFEHEVSIMTAKSIRENTDREKFDIIDIFIDKNGKMDESLLENIDVAFLAVHGPNCEDGKLQRYLENRGIKYTGPGIEASRINLDKTEMHDVFKANGLPVVEYRGFQGLSDAISDYVEEIGLPVVIKPNNMGSSVGMSKVTKMEDLDKSLQLAIQNDTGFIVEKAVEHPREIEIGILGNSNLIVSEPGEVITHGQVYSYETKYLNPFKTTIDPKLTTNQTRFIKDIALKAYKITGCVGYARIDFFLENENTIYLNEINTLPGFTSISMFPKLMANVGIPYKDLITKIIELALE